MKLIKLKLVNNVPFNSKFEPTILIGVASIVSIVNHQKGKDEPCRKIETTTKTYYVVETIDEIYYQIINKQ